jgi:hypothetical protein
MRSPISSFALAAIVLVAACSCQAPWSSCGAAGDLVTIAGVKAPRALSKGANATITVTGTLAGSTPVSSGSTLDIYAVIAGQKLPFPG